MPGSVEVRKEGNCGIVSAQSPGEWVWQEIDGYVETVMAAMRQPGDIVVDLNRADYVGSVGMAWMLRLEKIFRMKGFRVVIARPSELTLSLLKVTALDTVFLSYDSVEDAFAALANG